MLRIGKASRLCFAGASLLVSHPVHAAGEWKNITPAGANPGSARGFSAFAVDPNDPRVIYAGQCGAGVWKSTNAGESWTQMGNPSQLPGYDDTLTRYLDNPVFIEVDPRNSRHLYSNDAGWCGAGQTLGFWESFDGGSTWTMPSGFIAASKLPGNTRDAGRFDVDPGDFNHILISMRYTSVGDFGYLESRDGGKTFSLRPYPFSAGAGTKGLNFIHSPSLNIGSGDTWLSSSEGKGIYRTTDGGAHWTNTGPDIAGVHGGISRFCYTGKGVLYYGGSPNPIRSTDNGVTWKTISGLYGYVQSIVSDGATLYASMVGDNCPIYTSPADDGDKWTATEKKFAGYPLLTFDPAGRILYATGAGGVEALKIEGSVPIAKKRAAVPSGGTENRSLTLILDRLNPPLDAKGAAHGIDGRKENLPASGAGWFLRD